MSLIERAALNLPGAQPQRLSSGMSAPARLLDSSAPGRADRPGPAPGQASGALALGEPLAIDRHLLQRNSLLAPGAPASQTQGEFRILKRPLIRNAIGARGRKLPNGRRIVVCSALPGEGKTFCSINLALSIAAERDLGVVLIDADVGRPALHSRLGLRPGPGLMDALSDPGIDPVTLVHPTDIPGLSILLAGTRDAGATEMLASDRMRRIVQLLDRRFAHCILLFDAPPLLVTTESRVMASHAGQIVLVVERGRTSKAAVQAAVAALRDCEAPVSLLLNKMPPRGRRETELYGSYDAEGGYA